MRCCCAGEAGSSRLPSMLDSSSAESYGDVVHYVSAAPFALGKTVVISWLYFIGGVGVLFSDGLITRWYYVLADKWTRWVREEENLNLESSKLREGPCPGNQILSSSITTSSSFCI